MGGVEGGGTGSQWATIQRIAGGGRRPYKSQCVRETTAGGWFGA